MALARRTLRTVGSRTCLAVLAVGVLGACVEHRMVIRSDPEGATVRLDEELLEQTTPATVPFIWDGTRRVTLSADGHEVLETEAAIESRWYSYFPLDFFAEFLWPGTIVDEQVFEYRLSKYLPPEALTEEQIAALRDRSSELRRRAEEYRAGGSEGPSGAITVPPPAQPEPAVQPDTPAEPDRPKPAPLPGQN